MNRRNRSEAIIKERAVSVARDAEIEKLTMQLTRLRRATFSADGLHAVDRSPG
jgi:hypothetical protein